VFSNARGTALSRDGVNYVLQDAIRKAAKTCTALAKKRVSPHVLRHTAAMHLLQSGAGIETIALYLGHESPETTHMYVEADLKTKEQALQNVAPRGKPFRRFQAGDSLLAFLDSL
jgi:site-specific recombinase XerD